MDISLTPDEERRFQAWCHSPSVFSSNTDELIVAFKLGKRLHYPASRVLKVFRGLQGLDQEIVRQVEDCVKQDPSLRFTGESPDRLVVVADAAES